MEGLSQTTDLVWALFQGKEYLSAFGLNQYDFHSRIYDPYLGRFTTIDGANQFASGFVGMGNNPVNSIDPDGQLFFIIPQIGWSKSGGLSLGLEIGIGVPGALSASITGGYNFGSHKGYGSIQGYASGFYAGYGTQGGFAGWGYRYAGFSGGVSYGKDGFGVGISYGGGDGFNNGAIGVGWSQKGGFDFNTSVSSTFLYGSMNSYMYATPENTVKGEHPVDFSAQSVANIYNDNYSDLNIDMNFYAVDRETLPSKNGDAIAQTKFYFEGQKAKDFKLFFSRSAFTSREQLAFSLVHELGHVIHNNMGLTKRSEEKALSGLLDTEGHVNIQMMTAQLVNISKWNNSNISGQVTNFVNTAQTPMLYTPLKTLIRVIKFR